jgi:hypothetical protein
VILDQGPDDFFGSGITHDETLENHILSWVMNKIGVVQRIFCDHAQQVEIKDASLSITIHLLLDNIEEEAQVAVIAAKLIDNLDHFQPPCRHQIQRKISRRWRRLRRIQVSGIN